MRRFFLILFITMILAASAVLAPIAPALALDEVRIADARGDWGYPNPFRHYPRGPGYLRMAWSFDTLVWKNEKGYIPALAEKWEYLQAETAFVFKLRPGVKWHDGRAFTAGDVAFTVDYFKKHPYRWVTLDSVKEVKALDDLTVKFILTEPYAAFLSDIGGTMPVMPRHIWETVQDPRKFDEPGAFVGTGPYVFKDFNKAKGTYLYEAFKDYYQGEPKAKRLIYVKAGNPIMTLGTKVADLANIKPEMAPVLQKKGFTVLVDKAGWNKKLMINHRKPPMNDREFRHALAYAIDRLELLEKGQRGHGTVASLGLLSKDHEMYNPNTPDYPHDPAKARAILESLGYQRGSDGFYAKAGKPLVLEILASNITVAGDKAPDRDGEIIKRQLEAVGIKVNLHSMEQTTTDSKVKNWDFDLAVSGHGGIMGDPKILNEMISSKMAMGSVNCARFDASPKLNEVLDRQLAAMDDKERKRLVFEVQELYAWELPAISLYCPKSMSAYNPAAGVRWYYTPGGICKGIPITQNKMSLIE